MTIERIKIRNEILLKLLNRTLAEDRVYAHRSTPNWVETTPAVNFYFLGETITDFLEAPRAYKRDARVVFECVVRGDIDLDAADTLDTLSAQIEKLMAEDETLNCSADDVRLTSVDSDIDGDGDGPIHGNRLVYEVKYYTTNEPIVASDDLERAEVDWHIEPNEDGEADASDTITIAP